MKFYGKYTWKELPALTRLGMVLGLALLVTVVVSLIVLHALPHDLTPEVKRDTSIVRICKALDGKVDLDRVKRAFEFHEELGAPAIAIYTQGQPCVYDDACNPVDGEGEIWLDVWNTNQACGLDVKWAAGTRNIIDTESSTISWSGIFFQTGEQPFGRHDSLMEHELSHANGFPDSPELAIGHVLHHTPMTDDGGKRGWNTRFMDRAYSNLYGDSE